MMAASKFFKVLLGPSFREANQEEIALKEINGATLKSIIDYCYTGNIKITEDEVVRIAAAASSYEMIDVERKCVQFWDSILSNQNSVHILRMAEKFSFLDLQARILTFICENFATVPIADLVEINGETFEKILSSDQIKTTEDIVCDRLQQWIAKCEIERSDYIPILLKTIRLEWLESKVCPTITVRCPLVMFLKKKTEKKTFSYCSIWLRR